MPAVVDEGGQFYDRPGAFEHTVRKAKRSNFVNKNLQYPSSFGSMSKRL